MHYWTIQELYHHSDLAAACESLKASIASSKSTVPVLFEDRQSQSKILRKS